MLRDEKWARNTRNDTHREMHQGRRETTTGFSARNEWAKCGTRRRSIGGLVTWDAAAINTSAAREMMRFQFAPEQIGRAVKQFAGERNARKMHVGVFMQHTEESVSWIYK